MSITVSHLSKCFHLYARPLHRFKEWLTLGRRRYHTPFWALRDVDLEIPQGASMGIIGPNGAGKSTLLKIITGTLFPTSGTVRVDGRVAALLELGTGFHPEFTGRLNIYLNGKMLGLSDEEIAARFDEIVRFSELGDFIEQPLRTYSSGMTMRLGFSIASCVDPDVLIVDEALSVGDAYFSQKCVRRIREFREKGVTILFVSHDPTAVLTLCDHAVLLEEGAVQRVGSPEEVLDFYNARIAQRSSTSGGMQILVRDASDPAALGTQRSGNFRAVITAVEFRNAQGQPSEVFQSGEDVSLLIRVLFLEDIENPTVGVLFRNRLGIEVFGVNSMGFDRQLGKFRAGELAEVCFDFPLNLGPDDYSITVATHLDETHLLTNFDWIDKAWRFRVLPSNDFPFYGLARLDPKLHVAHVPSPDLDTSHVLRSVFGTVPERLDGAALCDRFFLEGWRQPEGRSADRSLRLLEGNGRFVFEPRARTLEVRLLGETVDSSRKKGDSSSILRMSWPGGAAVGNSAEDGLVRFDLPEDVVGKLRIFTLSVPSAAQPSGPTGSPLGVVSIQPAAEARSL